jgi:NAD(P)H-quinone oxidoreductase subunit 4
MLSHGLIAAALFYLSGITYDRTHTLAMEEMGGMAQQMPKVFALFTVGSMASLALPGMSGFVGELSIFLGVTTSDAYSSIFKVVVVLLAAVGLIMTPIYLLSMLRRVFYGKANSGLVIEKYMADANPREIFITACLLVPIIGIGLYPKIVTQTYDVKTVAVAAQVRNALPVIAQEQTQLYSRTFIAPQLPTAKAQALLGVID